jgi:hypothetical protein
MASGRNILRSRPISHVSYAVNNLEKAVEHWTTVLGAGPFFVVDKVGFDEISFNGGPCVWEHSAAFGQWGSISVELQENRRTEPAAFTRLVLPGPLPVVNHVAYLSETPEEDSRELAAAGHRLFLHARFGGIEMRFHDTTAAIGHPVEIHRDSAALRSNFSRIAAAALNWDGSNPLRPMGETP